MCGTDLCESDLQPGVESETEVHVALLFLDFMGLFVLSLVKSVQISTFYSHHSNILISISITL